MYGCVRATPCWCVLLLRCSANERLGVSEFQVPVLWERRWVTGLMNSDVRQLLINRETVCQPADWNSSPSPMCTCKHIHTHTRVQADASVLTTTNYINTHAAGFTSPSCASPVPAVELRPIVPLPPDTWVQCAYYSHCSHWGKALNEYEKYLPDVNGWGPEHKWYQILRLRHYLRFNTLLFNECLPPLSFDFPLILTTLNNSINSSKAT